MPVKPKQVDQYLEIGCGRCKFGGTADCKVHSWTEELALLRTILLSSGLREEIKWSAPCYTSGGKNIVALGALKSSAALSFFRGAEIADTQRVLEKPGENSRIVRYIRFTNVEQIQALHGVILDYIRFAIDLEKSGSKRAIDKTMPDYPQELTQAIEQNPELADAFEALTPGRQRGYLLHFSSAKQAKTRSARIEKCMPQIFAGKGWNER